MRSFFAVYEKDMKALFGSPVAYVFLSSFTVLAGLFFYRGILFFSSMSAQAVKGQVINANMAVFQPLFSNFVFILVLLIPLVTMRLFSEERRSGTLELLASYPVTSRSLVLAKFFCGLSITLCGLGITLVYPLIVSFFGPLDWGPVISSYLGLFLTASALVSLGVFFSSLTDNQIIAASAGLGASLAFWLVGWLSPYLPPFLGRFTNGLSFYVRSANFFHGLIRTDDALFFCLITLSTLVFTAMSLRSQRFGG